MSKPTIRNCLSAPMVDLWAPRHPRRLLPVEHSNGNLSDPRVVCGNIYVCMSVCVYVCMYVCKIAFLLICIAICTHRAVLPVLNRSCSFNLTIQHITALHTLLLHPNLPDRNLIRRRRMSRAPTCVFWSPT